MNTHILSDIAYTPDIESLKRRLRVRESTLSRFMSLFHEAKQVARPKAMYRPVYIEARTEEAIRVEGQWFHSRVLTVNVKEIHRIFIYTASCGLELDEWSKGQNETLEIFWAGFLKESALLCGIKALGSHLEENYRPGKTSHQNPGSLEDFPLTEQKVLFELLGDTFSAVGVTLLPSHMMSPCQSVSGIIFPAAVDFESCMLCPRENCPGRRASYDENLYKQKYSQLA